MWPLLVRLPASSSRKGELNEVPSSIARRITCAREAALSSNSSANQARAPDGSHRFADLSRNNPACHVLGLHTRSSPSMSITEFAHSLGWKQAGSVQHLAASGRRLHIWTPPLADSVAQPRIPRQHVSMAVKGQAPKNSRGRHNGTTPPRRRAGDSRPPPLAFGKGSVARNLHA